MSPQIQISPSSDVAAHLVANERVATSCSNSRPETAELDQDSHGVKGGARRSSYPEKGAKLKQNTSGKSTPERSESRHSTKSRENGSESTSRNSSPGGKASKSRSKLFFPERPVKPFSLLQSDTSASILLSKSCVSSLAFDKFAFNTAFNESVQFHTSHIQAADEDDEGEKLDTEKELVLNSTPTLLNLQTHFLKNVIGEPIVAFQPRDLYRQSRAPEEPGKQERDALDFLLAAETGNYPLVRDLMLEKRVHVNVVDSAGNSALLKAAVQSDKKIVNTLLDAGANVNMLTDETVSALVACFILYYPQCMFRSNTAERQSALSKANGKQPADFKPPLLSTEPTNITVASTVVAAPPTPTIEKPKTPPVQTSPEPLVAEDTNLSDLLELGPDFGMFSGSALPERMSLKSEVEEAKSSRTSGVSSRASSMSSASSAAPSIGYIRCDSGMTAQRLLSGAPDAELATVLSMRNVPQQLSDNAKSKLVDIMSANSRLIGKGELEEDPLRRDALYKARRRKLLEMIELLLRRGADPSISRAPFAPLFFAVKACDVEMVKLLLMKRADPTHTLPEERGRLTPLHIGVAMYGQEGVDMTRLLIDALADPNARALADDSFLITKLKEEWERDMISEEARKTLGGRTPLHIVCSRDDDFEHSTRIVCLLLQHHANPELLCNGQSALSLAIASGNDLAVDELLDAGCDPSTPLTHGVGSALCVALHPDYEYRRSVEQRRALVEKLLKAGADILAPIAVGTRRQTGTVVDYIHYVYNLDKRIAHLPYHALNQHERDTYNYRKSVVQFMGDQFRNAAIRREKERLLADFHAAKGDRPPSGKFVFTGTGRAVPPKEGQKVTFADMRDAHRKQTPAKFCYNCGRSVGVRLSPCTRCKEVNYCSKACKVASWNARHKEECIRITEPVGSRSKLATHDASHSVSDPPTDRSTLTDRSRDTVDSSGDKSGAHRAESPTSTTIANRDKMKVAISSNKNLKVRRGSAGHATGTRSGRLGSAGLNRSSNSLASLKQELGIKPALKDMSGENYSMN